MNAFATASNLVDVVAALPGTNKVMLAHSLGNMLTSSAAVDHGLQYSLYYMLNAAVPMEAYDRDAFTSNMIDSAWNAVPLNYRASDWNKLFSGNTNDFRYSLSWQGRFAGIANAVNCFSPTEDILENATENGYGDAWTQQELLKGSAVWHGVNTVLPWNWNERVSCEGGWGINTYYAADPTCYAPLVGFYASVSNLTREAAIEHPLFTPFRAETEAMHSTNLFYIADVDESAMLRAKLLGTDENGLCHVKGETNNGKTGVDIDKTIEGYYPFTGISYRFVDEPVIPFLHWRPTDLVITASLQRIVRPVPLFVKRAITGVAAMSKNSHTGLFETT